VARLAEMGLKPMMATELEFFLFRETYEALRDQGHRNLTTLSPHNVDYSVFLTSREENVMQAIRNGLVGANIPVECSKGEADAGQEEINIKYSDALDTADNHAITKNGCKEIAWQQGRALTFLAKWHHDAAGSSSHIHQSLWTLDGKPAFHDAKGEYGMSALMRHYMAGLLAHASEVTYFLAPFVNSYKRFAAGTFAPTKAIWSLDNRTAGYRLVASDSAAIRVECRVGGSDLNPYLAMATQIAAGIDGIQNKLALEPEFKGDAYEAAALRGIPTNLHQAADALTQSKMLRAAMGDAVIDHYTHAARWEQADFETKVTDYEMHRGFERA